MEYVGEGVAIKVFWLFRFEMQGKSGLSYYAHLQNISVRFKHPVNVELKLYQKFNKLNAMYIYRIYLY